MSRHLRKIQCKKRYFVKYFIVSLTLLVLVNLFLMFFKHGCYNFLSHFYNITYQQFSFQVSGMLNLWKVLILQFALAPMLAMGCLERYAKKHESEFEEFEHRI